MISNIDTDYTRSEAVQTQGAEAITQAAETSKEAQQAQNPPSTARAATYV